MDLNECLEREKRIYSQLESIYVYEFPLWRLVRNDFRTIVTNKICRTISPKIDYIEIIRNTIISFWTLLKLFFIKKEISNVFFPHSRLYYVNNIYLERFADPLIDYSGIKDDYLLFERPQNGTHKKPRYHKDKVIYLDFIEIMTRLCLPVAQRFVKWNYKFQIDELCKCLEISFNDVNVQTYKGVFVKTVAERWLQYKMTKLVLSRVNPKRIFLAHRETFNYVIAYAKKAGIKTIELQHGITIGETVLYSGNYNPQIDPDYLFVFGKTNIGTQFSIPIEKQINVGYPYKNFISTIGLNAYPDNCSLVISEPHVSDIIVNTLVLISKKYPQYEFHIRCHPQEILSDEDMKIISLYPNIKVVDNIIESFCVLSQYTSIVGENSSVLFEAMSMHKKVGRFNFNGLEAEETDTIHGGFKINSVDDFQIFMSTPYSDENDSKDLYSDFDLDKFNSIL